MTYHFSRARWSCSLLPLGRSIMPSTSPSVVISLARDHIKASRTHGLLVQPIEPQARRRRRLLRSCTDLVDCIERMTEDAIYTELIVSKCYDDFLIINQEPAHIPTESDITIAGYALSPEQRLSRKGIIQETKMRLSNEKNYNAAMRHEDSDNATSC